MTPGSLSLLLVAAAASPSPQPADVVRTPPAELVTPGTIGFLVTFGVAVALVLLVRDMVRRNRGLVVRAERRDAELRAAESARGGDAARTGAADATGGPGRTGGSGTLADRPRATRPGERATDRERDDRGGPGPAAPNA